jgi:hypothetical protein
MTPATPEAPITIEIGTNASLLENQTSHDAYFSIPLVRLNPAPYHS